ncbi:MAG: XRE family transcriptional regulator [Mesorhizobium sp.]|nr:MAG: XRE family transcriptional regulator [Mesorhizobium sp.]RWK16224.1 MAG: XRE family transcriptional regulator [Mesorhizobium sp.]
MTQRDLAKQMSKTQQTVARWETGAALLNVEQVEDLCLTLKCTTEQVLGFNVDIDKSRTSISEISTADMRYGTLELKTTVDNRNYPIDENARMSILFQLKRPRNPRASLDKLYFCSLNNKVVHGWDVGEVPGKLRNECQIVIAEMGEEEAMRMVSFVRVTYDNGEHEWNFLDRGSATTLFGMEAATPM